MKTKTIIIGALLLLFLIALSYNRKKNYKEISNNNLELGYKLGWINGANAVMEMESKGLYNCEHLKLIQLKDSIRFAKLIDSVE